MPIAMTKEEINKIEVGKILKVEADAYYIIDTLGERLYEGCNQAYILKFDSSTVINKLKNVDK